MVCSQGQRNRTLLKSNVLPRVSKRNTVNAVCKGSSLAVGSGFEKGPYLQLVLLRSCLVQESETYGTRATLVTPSNMARRSSKFHIAIWLWFTWKVYWRWLVSKNLYCWHTEWFETLIQHTFNKRLLIPA